MYWRQCLLGAYCYCKEVKLTLKDLSIFFSRRCPLIFCNQPKWHDGKQQSQKSNVVYLVLQPLIDLIICCDSSIQVFMYKFVIDQCHNNSFSVAFRVVSAKYEAFIFVNFPESASCQSPLNYSSVYARFDKKTSELL